MPAIRLLALTAEAFKGLPDGTYALDADRIAVTGDNGVGKTALGEAILYACCGLTPWGSPRVDAWIRRGAAGFTVTCTLQGRDGAVHTLPRRHTPKGTRLTLDGQAASQADLEAVIGPADAFRLGFWPAAWLALPDAEARAPLLAACPPADPAPIWAQVAPDVPLPPPEWGDPDPWGAQARRALAAALAEAEAAAAERAAAQALWGARLAVGDPRDPAATPRAEYLSYTVAPADLPEGVRNLLHFLGFPSAAQAAPAPATPHEDPRLPALLDALAAAGWLPEGLRVALFDDPDDRGRYDPDTDTLWLHCRLLDAWDDSRRRAELLATWFHELAHRASGAPDCDAGFERMLTRLAGHLADACLHPGAPLALPLWATQPARPPQ